jgi:predicted TIM-barrel fold metal-dependent hydrolase
VLPYIDVHAHIGDTVSRVPTVGQTLGRYLARMAGTGVVAAVLSPAGGGPQARGVLDTRDQNAAIVAACRLYPDRFPVGLGVVEVRHGADGVRELVRSMDEGGLRGFMVHPGLSGHALGRELHPFLEVVAERSGLCLLHQRGSTGDIAAYARRFPAITFIVGHVATSAASHRDAVEHLRGLDNVWYDIAQHPADPSADWDLAQLLRGLNPEHLLFGSDTPYYDFRRVQALLEGSGISQEDKHAIAWRNAAAPIRHFRPDWGVPETAVVPPQRYGGSELWATQAPGSPRLL